MGKLFCRYDTKSLPTARQKVVLNFVEQATMCDCEKQVCAAPELATIHVSQHVGSQPCMTGMCNSIPSELCKFWSLPSGTLKLSNEPPSIVVSTDRSSRDGSTRTCMLVQFRYRWIFAGREFARGASFACSRLQQVDGRGWCRILRYVWRPRSREGPEIHATINVLLSPLLECLLFVV